MSNHHNGFTTIHIHNTSASTPAAVPNICFRTDGNSDIATGHLMRCLTIARACAKMGAKVSFILSDNESLRLLKERFAFPQEFETYCLNSDYRLLPLELPVLSAYLRTKKEMTVNAFSKLWLFVDSYYATPAYLEALGQICQIAYLDDLRSFDCPVDLVINYDTDEDCPYYARASRKLLGVQYTPLREQFQAVTYDVRPLTKHVLLSTGGTDPFGVAQHLLEIIYCTDEYGTTHRLSQSHCSHCDTLSDSAAHFTAQTIEGAGFPNMQAAKTDHRALRSLHYHILTSRANTRYNALSNFAQNHPGIHIHEGVADVASLMASCDLAVSAGGATLCELCAVGVPSISYLMADNQRTAVKFYEKQGLIPCAGDIRPANCSAFETAFPNSETVSVILNFLTYMSQNHAIRKESSQQMRAFLNGSGAKQIARALLS